LIIRLVNTNDSYDDCTSQRRFSLTLFWFSMFHHVICHTNFCFRSSTCCIALVFSQLPAWGNNGSSSGRESYVHSLTTSLIGMFPAAGDVRCSLRQIYGEIVMTREVGTAMSVIDGKSAELCQRDLQDSNCCLETHFYTFSGYCTRQISYSNRIVFGIWFGFFGKPLRD
jgi:hypothetical protein